MKLKDKLKALLAEAEALRAKSVTADFTTEDAERAQALAVEVADVRKSIKTMEKAAEVLNSPEMTQPTAEHTQETAGVAKTVSGSIGDRFVASDGYRAFKAESPQGPTEGTNVSIKSGPLGRFTAKAPLNTVDTGHASPVRVNEVDDLVYRPERTLLNEISRGTTNLPYVQYRQVISKTNNAAIVPEHGTVDDLEASLKPLSTLTTKTADAREYTYADGMEVTNQELADDGIIGSLIDSTLVENLEIQIENILINGAGTEVEPAGIMNTTGVLHQGFDTDMVTSVRKAITRLRTTSGAQIRGVLLNPEDDEAWDLLKDAEGRFLGAGPFGTGPGTAWGYERISSQAVEVGQAIIGDFKTIHFLDYSPLEILAFNQHKDYAQRNLTYVRAELRALQMIRNAARLCIVDLVAG